VAVGQTTRSRTSPIVQRSSLLRAGAGFAVNGFAGRILRVDLGTGDLYAEPRDEELGRLFVGGSGLAAAYLFDTVCLANDPLAPENPLAFMTGPLVGTAMPSAGRCAVCARSPLTGIWGESNTGGFFGPELRFAGYDGIIVTGRATAPVWLSVVDGTAEIHDASALWGLDTYETQARVLSALKDRKAHVACIGPAGENLVKMAAVVNDHGRVAARTGLGAVMGAHNLKAIAVRGSERVPVADAGQFEAVVRQIHEQMDDDGPAQSLRILGTAGYVDAALMYGDMPIRYFQQGRWEAGHSLSGVRIAESYLDGTTSCYRCPIACGRRTRAPRYGLHGADGPEYQTVAALGTLLLVDDLEAVIYGGHLCNLLGLDTISVGCTIALACSLFEKGVLTAADTGGIELRFGDAQMMHSLIGMIARREGIGDVLAEGSASLAEWAGAPELCVAVNRLDVPMHDPRAFAGLAVSYALSPRGACHMQGDVYTVDLGQSPLGEVDIVSGDRFESTIEKGRTCARLQAWRNLYNSMILCQFQNPGAQLLLAALNAVTGWDVAMEDLVTIGKRIATLKRILNLRLGVTRADDRLPEALMRPLGDGGTEGHVPDVDTLLVGAYDEYGWDPLTGKPTGETIARLGLRGVVGIGPRADTDDS
jgi:aldehyde:ferredoxin oxidoreductase